MDFMEGLARSNHANSILVVVDSFTKYDHFLPLSHPFTAMGVAWLPLAELRSGLLGCLFAELFISSLDDWASTPLKLCMDTLRVILASLLWTQLMCRAMTDLIHQHLCCAKERMKHQTDKKRSERQFQGVIWCLSSSNLMFSLPWRRGLTRSLHSSSMVPIR